MKLFRLFFVFLFLVGAGEGIVFSQEEVGAIDAADQEVISEEDWQDTIEHVSAETNALLSENEKLNLEYEFLQKKSASLKSELEQTSADVKKFESAKKKGQGIDVKAVESMLPEEMSQLQQDIDKIESENKKLQKQLADLQEKNRLWKIQAAQLNNEKRDGRLDLNYEQAQAEAEASVSSEGTTDLEEQLAQSLREEKELAAALSQLASQKEQLPKEAALLKKKNKELEVKVLSLKKQIVAQDKKNEKLNKTGKVGSSAQKVSPELVKKKKELEAEVAKLSAQLDGVNATVTESKDVLGKKRQLMDKIMYLDAENQALRSQIDEMLQQSTTK